MRELWRQFGLAMKIGTIGALLGAVAGAAIAIAVEPIAGSIFVGITLAILAGGMWMGFGSQVKRNRLLSRGVRTQATLLEIRESGVTVQENYGLAKLRLRVQPPDGSEPYEATTKALINRFEIPAYQPGTVLDVVVDPGNRNNVAVV